MLKTIIKNKGMSVRKLSIITDIPYSTLNDIVNDKVNMDNVRFGYVRKLADALDIDIGELAGESDIIDSEKRYKISVYNKSYYLVSAQIKTPVYLCKVTSLSSRYIRDIAEWEYEDYTTEKELGSWRKNIIS